MKKPLLVLLVIGLLGADTPKDYDDTVTNAEDVTGAWKLVAAERNGVAFPFSPIIETYRAGGYTTTNADGMLVDEGTYAVNRGARPATLDESSTTAQPGRTYHYLYQLNGNTLRIAYFGDCSVRPKSFDDKNINIITFKREKN